MNNNMVKPQLTQVNIKEFDDAMQTMIKNDCSLIPKSNISPTVWKCSWYNVNLTDRNKSQYCYKKGDTVWVNTEELASFTQANYHYIKLTVMNNSYLRKKYQQIQDNESEVQEFFQNVVTGKITGNAKDLPLFYIGNLTDKVQIRVSLSDDNDKLPTDNAYWKDFFVNNDRNRFQQIILDRTKELLSAYLESHLKNYHLSGIFDYWYDQYGEIKSLSDFYLLQDMSNVGKYQDFNVQNGTSQSGFDYVVYFHQHKFTGADDKCMKWFRVWNSGKVEHGGIVKNNANNATIIGDSIVANGKMYKVNLTWSDSNVKAPSYTYPVVAGNFYQESDYLDIGDKAEVKLEESSRMLDPENRYTVVLTPVSNTPYSEKYGTSVGGIYYAVKDICSMTNSSFCFLVQSNVQYYSYYAYGISKNVEQQFK